MSKGMTGEAVRTVILLVVAVVALALIWMFFFGYVKFAAFGLEDIVGGLRGWVCDKLPVGLEQLCKGFG